MQVIKITKSFSVGVMTHYLTLFEGDWRTFDDIDRIVEDWGYSDFAGQNSGYEINWQIVDDENLIVEKLNENLSNIDYRIKKLKDQRKEINLYLEQKDEKDNKS